MEHSRKESNTRLFIAQNVAIETLRELCGPVPPSSQTQHSGPSTQHSPPTNQHPTDPVADAADLRRERRLALQERSIRLRAALALLRLTPFEIEDDDEAPAASAASSKERHANKPQPINPTPRNRPPLPPRPHPFAGIPAWNNSSIPDEPVTS